MMEFVYGHDKEVAQFIATFTRVGNNTYANCKTIGVIDDEGRLIAGMVYYNFDPRSEVIELGVATITPRWLTRATYRRMFEYPFLECGCQMLVARVRADDERTLSILARMNFNLMPVPRLYGRGEDGVLCTLTDDQWLDSNVAKRVYRNVKKDEEAA